MNRVFSTVAEFLRLEAAAGIALFAAGVAAMALANSPLAPLYGALLELPLELRAGTFEIAKPLLLWINDGLMAAFFFLVGLEIKREVLQGELSKPAQVALPAIAAAAGMIVPALLYLAFNRGDPVAARGWAIPAATDIAFAVGVLALLGRRVPPSLKVFLLTLAILDDLGAIVVIALFYTDNISIGSLGVAVAALGVLAVLNRRGVTAVPAYLLVGLVMWTAVLKSGMHATLAGAALAMFIPLRVPDGEPPLVRLERELHPSVAFAILPLFAFANAGLPLAGITLSTLAAPLPAGIALGLVLGKIVGVFGATLLAVKTGLARLPEGAGWLHLLGISALCGVGFTMSLFIAGLAFEGEAPRLAVESRLGILIGSLVSGVAGYLTLRLAASLSAREK
ncbi:MAG TPA: Na+/H+ antiporter NhaA [Burkholderiales bacterium]|nr:Na+/H+ antiporter NhaA [Burkholderiales bacterium]